MIGSGGITVNGTLSTNALIVSNTIIDAPNLVTNNYFSNFTVDALSQLIASAITVNGTVSANNMVVVQTVNATAFVANGAGEP